MSATSGPDLSAGWRDVPYAFLGVEELGGRGDELTDLVEVAIVGMGAEPVFHSLIGTNGRLHRLAPGRLGRRGTTVARTAWIPEVCLDLEHVLSGRIAVAHGASLSWRLLLSACPGLRPLALLDSLCLARALLPGDRQDLQALGERLDMPRPDIDAEGAMRSAVVLARVFERMVDRTLPRSTVGYLVYLGDCGPGDAQPDVGLEVGR